MDMAVNKLRARISCEFPVEASNSRRDPCRYRLSVRLSYRACRVSLSVSLNGTPMATAQSEKKLCRSCMPANRLQVCRIIELLAGVPVGGKLSVCLICMKYRIIILIIIIKRLGEILLSYMANTAHTHARTHPVSMYFPSQHFMVLLVDDALSVGL